MSTILTHGTEIPASGDSGSIFCPMIERNWTRYDAHLHKGGTSGESLKSTGAALAAAWVLDANDVYKQTINLPTGFLFADTLIRCAIDNIIVDLKLERVSNSSFSVYCNDNSKQVDFLYI
jgi:hypothetical protein